MVKVVIIVGTQSTSRRHLSHRLDLDHRESESGLLISKVTSFEASITADRSGGTLLGAPSACYQEYNIIINSWCYQELMSAAMRRS